MNWWILRNDPAARITFPYFDHNDPGGTLDLWRRIKLERGLVRHPSPDVRVPACRELLELGNWGQDECWEALSESDRAHLHDSGYTCCSARDVAKSRLNMEKTDASWLWRSVPDTATSDACSLRSATAVAEPSSARCTSASIRVIETTDARRTSRLLRPS